MDVLTTIAGAIRPGTLDICVVIVTVTVCGIFTVERAAIRRALFRALEAWLRARAAQAEASDQVADAARRIAAASYVTGDVRRTADRPALPNGAQESVGHHTQEI